jgi:D-2-hydroxyglutarate dehydrogenase
VITDKSEIEPHNSDWTHKYTGHSPLVIKPKTTEEVSRVLKYCNERKLAVVPQGGNTGLVGGSNPVHDEVILNLSLMDKVLGFDSGFSILSCEAGCVLEDLQNYLEGKGHTVPLDLGAKGSCQIGGNLSTNAGGIRFIRYGSMHANSVGLKVVLPNGTILDNMTTLRKDNTGYDLKHLFIGAEGSLGVITECSLLCPVLPKSTHLCFLGCESYEKCQEILKQVKLEMPDIVLAVEFMDRCALDMVCTHLNH